MSLSRGSRLVGRRLLTSNVFHQHQQIRSMSGGGHYMQVGETHKMWGEIFGVFCWLWVFHRARHDLPVVLGWRHPWDHVEDPFAPHAHAPDPHEASRMKANWDKFSVKAIKPTDDDDDDEEEEEEED